MQGYSLDEFPPTECDGCRGQPCPKRIYPHGSYSRYRHVEGDELIRVQRYICAIRCSTFSIIPSDMLPYRAIQVPELDHQFERIADGLPLEGSEITKNVFHRAFATYMKFFIIYVSELNLSLDTDPKECWRQMHLNRHTYDWLHNFCMGNRHSLLREYQSHLPWWKTNRYRTRAP